MDHITETMKNDGTVAVNIFPAGSYVVLSYADRVAQEVVSIISYFNSTISLFAGRRVHHAAAYQGSRNFR